MTTGSDALDCGVLDLAGVNRACEVAARRASFVMPRMLEDDDALQLARVMAVTHPAEIRRAHSSGHFSHVVTVIYRDILNEVSSQRRKLDATDSLDAMLDGLLALEEGSLGRRHRVGPRNLDSCGYSEVIFPVTSVRAL